MIFQKLLTDWREGWIVIARMVIRKFGFSNPFAQVYSLSSEYKKKLGV